jgi:hypothetical protein
MKKMNPVVICIFEGLDENLNGLQFCIILQIYCSWINSTR